MGKNRTKPNAPPGEQVAGKAGQQHNRDGKPKPDGKPRRAEDHINDIPFRLREIMKSKERMKMGKKSRKKEAALAKAKAASSSLAAGDIQVPHFKRRKKETERAYLRRMETESQHVLFLTKNQLDRKPELEEEKQENPAYKAKSEKRKGHDQVRLQKLKERKQGKQEDKLEKEMRIDDVAFGEVAMAPPSLTVKPRRAPVKGQNAPKALLLNSLLGHTVASTAKASMARQRMMEEERVRAVEAYRHLKKLKQQQWAAKAAGVEKLKNL